MPITEKMTKKPPMFISPRGEPFVLLRAGEKLSYKVRYSCPCSFQATGLLYDGGRTSEPTVSLRDSGCTLFLLDGVQVLCRLLASEGVASLTTISWPTLDTANSEFLHQLWHRLARSLAT
jgi:hypothetical protein